MYCCDDFITDGVYIIGHYDKHGVFYTLNDISDFDKVEQEDIGFNKNIILMRTADRFGNIDYPIIEYCPFCGAKL